MRKNKRKGKIAKYRGKDGRNERKSKEKKGKEEGRKGNEGTLWICFPRKNFL